MDTMQRLAEYALNRPAELVKLRARGTKVIGYLAGDFIPEELIYAAGAVPVCLLHGGDGGFIMGTGCEMPPAVKLDNWRAMIETARNYELSKT